MLIQKRYVLRPQALLSYGVLLAAMLIGAGCGMPRGELYSELDKPLYWPEPPETPRIKYLGQFSSEDDLKREVSGGEALSRLIFGREEIGVFARPHSVVKDQDKLYVADSSGSAVHILDLEKRKYLQFFKINDTKRLISPIGLAVVGDNVFIADSILAEICVFDTQGNFIFSFGSEILQRPSGLAYSRQQQKFYVSDTKWHTVLIFDLKGHCLGELGEPGAEPRQFNFPTQLWVGQDDKLYVSDTLNYRVQVFSPESKHMLSIGQHGDRPGCFAHPCGLATDNFGNIYVGDRQFENIQIFNSRGEILMAFGSEGNSPGEFWLPSAIFIDGENRIYVADSFNKRIQVFQLLESQVP
ncbi:MAG: 6-bladed beta-propeller [Phycisphaerae bacterium]|nr:6-bladed beta-propeller [Phycisphaerae bacterium]